MSWKCHGLVVLLAVLLAFTLRKKSSRVMIWVATPDSTGLQHDAIILERFLANSQTVLLSQPPPPPPPAMKDPCVYLFLEVSLMNLPSNAHSKWKTLPQQRCRAALMVNTDQFSKQLLETPNLELILCKTRQCVEWVHKEQQVYRREREMTAHRPHPPIPILYTGFTSQLPSPTTPNQSLARFDKFLHVAGKSPHKGTMSIVQAWIQHPEWPTLTLTSFDNPVVDSIMNSVQHLPPNIDHCHSKLTKAEMANIQQNHGVHLCVSGMEGFGHYINEGRAVGALVVTTDYPAMNELIHEEIGILVPPTQFIPWHNGLPYAHVSADAISQAMKKILTKSLQERADIGARARRAFFQDEAEFAKRVKRVHCYFSTCKGIMVNDVAESRACAENACGLQFE